MSEGQLQPGALGGARRHRRTQRSCCEAFEGQLKWGGGEPQRRCWARELREEVGGIREYVAPGWALPARAALEHCLGSKHVSGCGSAHGSLAVKPADARIGPRGELELLPKTEIVI